MASRNRYVEHVLMDRRNALPFMCRHGSRTTVASNRVAGVVGFGARDAAFPLLARLRPARADDYRLRGRAASALRRRFLFDHS